MPKAKVDLLITKLRFFQLFAANHLTLSIFVQAFWFKMMATVEKVEMEMQDITHQEISQEERSLESGQKKYEIRFCDIAGLVSFYMHCVPGV